jgi:hypothetical protein
MDSLASDYARGILASPEAPCLSVYQPTHRSHPDNQQDPIRFRNLVKSMEESLREKYSNRDMRPLLEPFKKLAENHEFWNHTLDGLAVLGAPDIFRVYRLQRPVPELAVVAESFHLKPLLRILQSAGQYQVLSLTRQEVRLFEGNRDALDEVELSSEVLQMIAQPDTEEKERGVEVWTYRAGSTGAGVRSESAKADIVKSETEKFFRTVDRAILENYSRQSEMPLVLAALPEHQAVFRQISHNPFLLPESIDTHPEALSIDELRQQAWQVLEPHYLTRLAGLVEMFSVAKSRELGTDDLAEIAQSSVAGRVATLLVDADRHIPGRVLPDSGIIEFDDPATAHVDDLLDDIAELVLKKRGQVVIVPTERMPTQNGAAAIFRF